MINHDSTTTVRAIETHYKGYRFRSRLEARWAVFFDALGVEWQYESQGFEKTDHDQDVDGLPNRWVRYLPDFYLPQSDTWVEVKGSDAALKAQVDDLEFLLDFGSPLPGFDESYGSTHGLLLLGEIPEPRWGLTLHQIVQHSRGLFFQPAYFSNHHLKVMDMRDEEHILFQLFELYDWNPWSVTARFVPTVLAFQKTVDAYSAARSARFEHGE